ncbi:MAG: GNAT family N-acetyltransferase [Clostridiales bacterium]|nr:GNAT family N-acetyltransferase [Clostridiales bacterium]
MLNYHRVDKESDYEVMRRIVQKRCASTGHLYTQMHVGNLDFERYAFRDNPDDFLRNSWLITDNKSETIGFIMTEDDEFFISLLPEKNHLISEVIDYIEQHIYKTGSKVIFDINIMDSQMKDMLIKKGYTRTSSYRYSGFCDLSSIRSKTVLPRGYRIRKTNINDIERRVKLFVLATGGVETTTERYKNLMNSPSYSDAFDLVVESPDGEIVAYCTIWNDPISKVAILEPLACIEEERRKGISKALLLDGMHKVKELKTQFVYVGTGGQNATSQTLYKSVGFKECGLNYEWEKVLVD